MYEDAIAVVVFVLSASAVQASLQQLRIACSSSAGLL